MSFIRPEASRTLSTWAEPAIYAGLGILCGVKGIGLLANGGWFGGVLAALGLLAIFAFYGAVTRAVYAERTRVQGPGIVSVLEGRISYLGPLGGAVIARDALISVDIVTNAVGSGVADLHWVLSDESQQRVAIPGSATDADKLLDTLGALPGFDHDAIVRAMKSRSNDRFPVWRRSELRRAVSETGQGAGHSG